MSFKKIKLIKQGAEAKLFLAEFDKQKVVIKDRIRKKYRIRQIDEKIRKKRTSLESSLISEARRAGVPTPKILEINRKNHKLIMEFVEGKRIKELLQEAEKRTIKKICTQIGRMIGKLHSVGIIHGDLTTSNMILKNGKTYFIDFGLGFFSKKIEDQGTDLKLLREALKSTHFQILDLSWKSIVEGYRKEYPKANEVLRRVEEIEKRARYMKR
jgi:Kae1-associated kinase Bud32